MRYIHIYIGNQQDFTDKLLELIIIRKNIKHCGYNFLAALFIIAKLWKQSKYTLMDE